MSLPDYYLILQVHPKAEPEIVTAAYRRLMKKYHPDALQPSDRNDPAVLRRVQEINQAYEVLSNPDTRALYDQIVQVSSRGPGRQKATYEKRYYQVRCSKTHNTYSMILARRKGSQVPYQIIGFEPVAGAPSPQRADQGIQTLLVRLARSARFWPTVKTVTVPPNPVHSRIVVDQDAPDPVEEPDDLSATEIYWGSVRCPACQSEYTYRDGVTAHWMRCNLCEHLFCVGGVRATPVGSFVTCPWCGRRAKLNSRFYTGQQLWLPVSGEQQAERAGVPPRLEKKQELDGGDATKPRLS